MRTGGGHGSATVTIESFMASACAHAAANGRANDNKAHRLTIQSGPASDATFIGFEGWPAPLVEVGHGPG
jgi:hypothetical protein